MTEYLVTWSIELDAESPEDAALQALAIHRDPESLATVFNVAERLGPGMRRGFVTVDVMAGVVENVH